MPCTGSAQGYGGGNQKYLYDSVDAGIGVTIYHIPHGIGKQKPGNQLHQSADGNCVWVCRNTQSTHDIGKQCQKEGRGDSAEEGICLPLLHPLAGVSGCDAANSCAQTVEPTAAKKQAKARCAQKVTNCLT